MASLGCDIQKCFKMNDFISIIGLSCAKMFDKEWCHAASLGCNLRNYGLYKCVCCAS